MCVDDWAEFASSVGKWTALQVHQWLLLSCNPNQNDNYRDLTWVWKWYQRAHIVHFRKMWRTQNPKTLWPRAAPDFQCALCPSFSSRKGINSLGLISRVNFLPCNILRSIVNVNAKVMAPFFCLTIILLLFGREPPRNTVHVRHRFHEVIRIYNPDQPGVILSGKWIGRKNLFNSIQKTHLDVLLINSTRFLGQKSIYRVIENCNDDSRSKEKLATVLFYGFFLYSSDLLPGLSMIYCTYVTLVNASVHFLAGAGNTFH